MAAWIVVILAAAFLRFYRLDGVPVGLHFDEAGYLIDSLGIGWRWHPIFFPNNNGREPLFLYWEWAFTSALGGSVYAARLSAAFLGLLTVPATGFCATQLFWRSMGPWRARWLGLASGAVLAGLYWHVNFSRIGLRTISLPLLAVLCFGLVWRGLRTGQPRDFVLAGLWGGLSIYTYIASRLLPAILALGGAWGWMWGRLSARERSPGSTASGSRLATLLARMSLVWVLVVAPIGAYWALHPNEFSGRSEGVSLFNPDVNHGQFGRMLGQNVINTLLMFNVKGSLNGAHNLPGRPVFDPLMGAFFLIGAAVCLARPRPPRAFALIWLACALGASIFSVDAPYFLRLTLAIPPTAILTGLGLLAVASRLSAATALGLIGGASLLSAGLTFDAYFRQWAPSEAAYGYMMADKVEASHYLNSWVKQERVFLAPLYRQDLSFELLTRDRPIGSFDAFHCTVLPAQGVRNVRYVFPPFDGEQPRVLRSHLPPATAEQDVPDSRGRLLLRTLEVPGAALPPAATDPLAVLGDQIVMVSATVGPGPARRGADLSVAIEWQSLAPTEVDYTVALHLLDGDRRLVAQRDVRPCAGTYPTFRWQVGDRVRDSYQVPRGDGLPAGVYRLVVSLYELPSLRTLPLTRGPGSPGEEVDLGDVSVTK